MRILRMMLFVFLLILINSTIALADINCYKCHDKKDFSGRYGHQPVVKGACYECHSPHVAKYKNLLRVKETELCFQCHSKVKKEQVDKKVVHPPFAESNCVACHNPHGSSNKGLLTGSNQGEGCLNCHKDLVDKYKIKHPPFAEGDCGACHNAHSSDRIQLLIDEPDKLCVSCHDGEISSSHKGFPVKVKERACLTCHNPHGSDRPSLVRNVLHEAYKDGCSECHDKAGATPGFEKCLECHDEIGEKINNIHSHQTNKSGNGCINCHSPHASDYENLLRNRQEQVCRKCHFDTWANYEDKPFQHPDRGICSNCHGIHGSGNLAMLKSDGNATCEGCHETQGKFTHPVGDGVLDPRNGQTMTCVTCHYPHGTVYEHNLKLSGSMELCIQCHKNY